MASESQQQKSDHLVVYHVQGVKGDKEGETRDIWHRVGAAFPLKNKTGYKVVLNLIPAPSNGQFEFVMMPPRPPAEEGASTGT